jgi:hypothetical protein
VKGQMNKLIELSRSCPWIDFSRRSNIFTLKDGYYPMRRLKITSKGDDNKEEIRNNTLHIKK